MAIDGRRHSAVWQLAASSHVGPSFRLDSSAACLKCVNSARHRLIRLARAQSRLGRLPFFTVRCLKCSSSSGTMRHPSRHDTLMKSITSTSTSDMYCTVLYCTVQYLLCCKLGRIDESWMCCEVLSRLAKWRSGIRKEYLGSARLGSAGRHVVQKRGVSIASRLCVHTIFLLLSLRVALAAGRHIRSRVMQNRLVWLSLQQQ